MIIDYISTAMAQEDFEALFSGAKEIPGQQSAKFNRLMMEGMAANGIFVRARSGLPVTRSNCSRKYLPAGKRAVKDNLEYCYGSVWNLPVVKNLWQMADTYRKVSRDAAGADTAVVCDVLNASVALGASLAAKHKKIPCIGIVTDLPQLMVTGANGRHVRMVEQVLENCSGYVLLTEAMNEKVNPEGKPYVIIEGLCDTAMAGMVRKSRADEKVRKCIYAGLLDARYGVKAMVDGFVMADVADAQLHIYGSGPYEEELRAVAAAHKNVCYHGVAMNQEVVRAELNADLLVNPRPTHEEFTKYSFPSKNMEYMASGTAVLTCRLTGMPEEYWEHVYLADEETAEGFCEQFRKLLNLPAEQLERKGAGAREFVLTQKNNVMQAKKILQLLAK